jgi:hypothetical protein
MRRIFTDLQNDLADLVEEERQEDLKTGIFLSPHFPVFNFLSAWGTGVRLVLSDRKMVGRKINPCQSVASMKIRVSSVAVVPLVAARPR